MRGATHAAVGACLAAAAGLTPAGVGAAAALALAPDVDAPGTKAGRVVRRAGLAVLAVGWGAASGTWLALGAALAALPVLVAHRTWTHTVWAWLLVAGVGFALAGRAGLVAAAVGYGSHLVLDALTPYGIHPLWPCAWRLRLARVPTGSLLDTAIGLGAGILCLLSLGR